MDSVRQQREILPKQPKNARRIRKSVVAAVVSLALANSFVLTASAYDTSLAISDTDAMLALDPYVYTTEDVVSLQSTDYELSGTTLLQSKVFSTDRGELRDVVIDAASGAIGSIAAARTEEERRWREIHGALDLSLVEHLQTLQPTESMEIMIFPAETATSESSKGKKIKSPLEVMKSALRKAGIRNADIDLAIGAVRVSASVADIRSIIAFLPGAAAAYPWQELTTIGLNATKDSIQAPLVPAHAGGAGSDLTIAVYEPGACINRSHSDFQFVTFDERIGTADSCKIGNQAGHSTAVAGLLAASRSGDETETIGLFRGYVFDVNQSENVNSMPPLSALVARNPDFINISATTGSNMADDLDEAVYKHRIFVANGATNDSGIATCYSYNSLCVGGYEHKGTLGKGNFGDDYPQGRWMNDPDTGREEPDVVGPYSALSASYKGNHEPVRGTSFATPTITGLAALLVANYRSDLYRDPTLLRAVLMASASHPVANPDVTAPHVPDFNDGIDDRSGAGAPRGDRGKAILENGRFLSENLDRDADFTTGGKLNRSISFEATRGNTVRVVLTWDQCPVSLLSTRDALVADLDMVIDAPAAPLEVCDPSISPGCDGGGDGSDYYFGSELSIDDSLTKLTNTTSYSTYTYSTSTSLTSSTLAYEEPLLVADTGTVPEDSITTESSGTLSDSPTQFSLPALNLTRTYFSNPSAVDNYEILEFKAPATGTHYINITAPRWDICEYDGGRNTNVAVAWDVLTGSDL
jgi:hypothetical protein